MSKRLHRQHDERGAILVLSTVGIVLAMIMSAMAIDLGFTAQEARRNQKVADLAALDAVRDLLNAQSVATTSAVTRNKFPTSADHTVLAVRGFYTGGVFSPDTGGDAVKVTVTSPHTDLFPYVAGADSVTRSAIAKAKPKAGFSIGSSLVTLDTSTSSLLNPIVSQYLGGAVSLSLVSWQGLAGGKMTLGALQAELINLGFGVGTVDQLLAANLTLAKVYEATANALVKQGDTANASIFNNLRLAAVSAVTFKLGEMIKVEQGAQDAAAGAQLNLLQLVTGTAQAANGTNLVSVPNVGITVPNVSSTALSLKLIEGPKIYVGGEGTAPQVTTGQVQVTLAPTVNLVNLLGVLKVTGAVPVELNAAGASGYLKKIWCPEKDITVTADPVAMTGGSRSSQLSVTTLLNLPLLDVNVTSLTASVDGPPQDVTFDYNSEFNPPNNVSKHVGSSPVGLQSLTSFTGTTANVNALGLLGLGLTSGGVLAAVLAALSPIIGDVDNLVVTPLLKALGLDLGSADITALGMDPVSLIGLPECGVPTLVA